MLFSTLLYKLNYNNKALIKTSELAVFNLQGHLFLAKEDVLLYAGYYRCFYYILKTEYG